MHKTLFLVSAVALLASCAVMAWTITRAQEVRLIGECGGRYFAAMEEDMFPKGCEWIEPIRVDVQ